LREEIIGGLWEANIDWANYTGQRNDAVSYTKDAFIDAALEGKKFKIGIPVRLDGKYIPVDKVFQRSKDRFVILKVVDISLIIFKFNYLLPMLLNNIPEKVGWKTDRKHTIAVHTQVQVPLSFIFL